jgi:hypothetical protein
VFPLWREGLQSHLSSTMASSKLLESGPFLGGIVNEGAPRDISLARGHGGVKSVAVSTSGRRFSWPAGKRRRRLALRPAAYDHIHAMCGPDFFDDLIAHPEVKKAYERWLDGAFLRQGQGRARLRSHRAGSCARAP